MKTTLRTGGASGVPVWTTRRRQNGGGGSTGHGLCSVVVVRNRRAMQYYLWDDLDHTDHDIKYYTHIRLQ